MKSRLSSRFVAGVLAALFAVAALPGCQEVESLLGTSRPSARLAGVRLEEVSLQSATLLFDIEVENPYAVPLPLANLDYSLASKGQQFLGGESALQGTIPAGGRKTVSLPARLTFSNLLAVLKDVRPGAVVPCSAELGLSVDAPALGMLRLPLRKEGELPVPAAPKIESVDVSWGRLSLDEASGVVKLGLTNRNQFPVDLSRLAYSLFLGDTEIATSALSQPTSFAADGGRGMLEIPVTLVPKNLGAAAWRLLSGGGGGYELKGTMDVGTPFGPMSLPLGKD